MSQYGPLVRSALFEAGFVVLGVVLALGANEWRQDRADQVHARNALAAITEELVSNRDAAAASQAYHDGLMQLTFGGKPDGAPITPRDFPRGYVNPATLFDTAWTAARETGAFTNLDYATVLRLSRMYAQQDRYELQSRSVAQLLYSKLLEQGHEGVLDNAQNLGSLIATFAYRERELVAHYDTLLADLR